MDNIHSRRGINSFFLFLYIFTVLWYTVLKRPAGYHVAQFELFWSYKKWLAGDNDLGKEIIANIAMFIPFGYLLNSSVSGAHWQKRWRVAAVVAAAFLFSLTVEALQLFMMRGLFEWDDIFSNTLGAVTGIVLDQLICRMPAEKLRGIVSISIGFLFMLACLGIFISGRGKMEAEADSTSRVWCFQIDEEIVKDGKIQLTGFAFCYEQPVGIPKIILQSTDTGERVKLDMKYGLPRPDVNEYFLCGQDYTHVGFRASGEAGNGEYEVLIQWPRSLPISTGVFVGSSIHYAPKQEFAAPEIDAEFVRLGVLRVYRPKYHCWVYQYLDDLYWVVDPDFYFEDDGTTYIEYQISTTQIEKLPENRLANGYFWDDIGGYFEKYEMEGDWGKYRVMKREIPTAYSVTSIETGYYKNGEWIWREHFRPIYKFGR